MMIHVSASLHKQFHRLFEPIILSHLPRLSLEIPVLVALALIIFFHVYKYSC